MALHAQAPPAARQPARTGGSVFPQHPPADPAVVERGRGLFSVNCSFCHGSDARGGETGPNLLRSSEVLNDRNGERIGPVILQGRPDVGMPSVQLTPAQILDVTTFLHSIPVGGRDAARSKPPSILVGNANAGKAVFGTKCASCHTGAKDLKGVASRISDPTTLQQTWLMPGGGRRGPGSPGVEPPPVTVRVTFADGKQVQGRLERIDDFVVTLRDADGRQQSYPREAAQPKVDIQDPLQGHMDLLSQYSDKEIHDVTAYLVTLK